MKTNWTCALLAGLWLAGCAPKEPAPNEDVNLLYQRFHSKYNVISSVSSEAIDVNLDCKVSTDMTEEIPQLAPEYGQQLELRIYGRNKNSTKNTFLFNQSWPEQHIWILTSNKVWDGEHIEYQPGLLVNYNKQGTVRYFSFSPNLSQLQVQPATNENAFRWVFPQSATINKSTGTIQIVNKRRLYTSAGVKEVVITTVYERYMMST